MKLNIVAEGVETPEELDYLKLGQCDYFQGYHFARPIPFHQFCGYSATHQACRVND
ncbi:MAG: EAL domain-containing protein [Gammaproteobacteria bacterium]|nr:EAL domain-containing protein [Gammaproteobacteria bacterium]